MTNVYKGAGWSFAGFGVDIRFVPHNAVQHDFLAGVEVDNIFKL